ncbi:hypothetical protein G7Y89_g13228 [Cudoniella acicularis]|uniref:Uncharacterized protein n=1 Tax=Cudoniella acicularis TaxID=354080 RepID=A0A8H4R9Z1_9HELO|nr:hypothetical protein G7Y89_g13228 [Cudoniella acicularis]
MARSRARFSRSGEVKGSEASLHTISPITGHYAPWTFESDENHGIESGIYVSGVHNQKSSMADWVIETGAWDVGWPAGTAMGLTQFLLKFWLAKNNREDIEPCSIHLFFAVEAQLLALGVSSSILHDPVEDPFLISNDNDSESSLPSSACTPSRLSSNSGSQNASPWLRTPLKDSPTPASNPSLNSSERIVAAELQISEFPCSDRSETAQTPVSRFPLTPRERMIAEVSGIIPSEDFESACSDEHEFSRHSFTSRGCQDTAKRLRCLRDAKDVTWHPKDPKQKPPKEYGSLSSDGFLSRTVPLGSSCGTSSPPQSATPSGSRDSSGGFSSPSGMPSTPLGKASNFGSGNFGSGTYNETGLPEDTTVAVEISTGPGQTPRALPMVCWHRANGTPCKGKPGESPKSRHLLCDHSMSDSTKNPTRKKKTESPNHHTLSPPCVRCGRLFDSEAALKNHYKEDSLCDLLPPGESQPANDEICQTGASPERMYEIKQAMEEYGKSKTLPRECNPKELELRGWVLRNRDLYQGQSQETPETAEDELVVACTRKKRRALQLLRDYLEADSSSGEIGRLEPTELTRILHRTEAAMDLAEHEETQRENAAKQGRKRKRPSGSANASSSPAPVASISQLDSSPPMPTHSVMTSDGPESVQLNRLPMPRGPFPDVHRVLQFEEASDPSLLHVSKRQTTSAISQPSLSPSRQVTEATFYDEPSSANTSQNPGGELATPLEIAHLGPSDTLLMNDSDMPEASEPSASIPVIWKDTFGTDDPTSSTGLPDDWSLENSNFNLYFGNFDSTSTH